MKKKRILLVEDNIKVQNYNKQMLADEGFAVETTMTLCDAKEAIARQMPDAVILDIGMPDGNGLDFLRELRKTSKVPVLCLTGYGDAKDIVRGFESGCDDYLPKPYTFAVLLARLTHLLQSAERVPETVNCGFLTLHLLSREAYVNDENLLLTPKDFALLQYFIQNENRTMSTEHIFEVVWGQKPVNITPAFASAISRLRRKLSGCGYTITLKYRTGYCFERDSE